MAAGRPSDIVARPIAKGLNDALGKPFIVDNRAGAGGNIGSAAVAKAVPDGHTLLITSSAPIVINPHVYKTMPYEPQRDLAPVTNLLRVPLVLVVHASVPANDVKGLVAHIQSQSGKFQYASSGNGTPQHMTGELFKTTAKLEMVHVPYKGSAPAINDVLAGHAPMMFDSTVAILPHIKSGRLKAIAVTSAKRSPAIARSADVRRSRPAGGRVLRMVRPVRAGQDAEGTRCEDQCRDAEGDEGGRIQRVLEETGSEFVGDTPENFVAFVKSEADKWGKVAKATGATVD